MSLIKNNLLVYPLKQYKVQIGEKIVYNRDTRKKSWFIVDLVLPDSKFIPANSTGLITSDNEAFRSASRHKEIA